MRAATPHGGGLVEVRLLDLPLEAYRSSSEHHDELFREFALLLSRRPSSGHELPGRLLRLVKDLTSRFASFAAAPTSDLLAALQRGEETIDLTYRVPADTAEALAEFARMLREADEYCRQGELLTLAPPPEAVAFREWYLGEFVAQIAGRHPRPWPEAG